MARVLKFTSTIKIDITICSKKNSYFPIFIVFNTVYLKETLEERKEKKKDNGITNTRHMNYHYHHFFLF